MNFKSKQQCQLEIGIIGQEEELKIVWQAYTENNFEIYHTSHVTRYC